MKNAVMRYAILFCVAIIFLTTLPICAQAEVLEDCPFCGSDHDLKTINGFHRWVFNMEVVIFGGRVIGGSTEEILKFDITGATFGQVWAATKEAYNYFSIVGTVLAIVYTLYHLLTRMASEELTPELFFSFLVRLFATIIFCRNSIEVIEGLMALSTKLFNDLKEATTSHECTFGESDIFEKCTTASQIFMPWVFALVVRFVFSVICWARIINIIVLTLFAPIGMADLFTTGSNSAGMKYLKNLFTVLIQGCVVLAIARTYGLLASSFGDSAGGLAVWSSSLVGLAVLIWMVIQAPIIASEVAM